MENRKLNISEERMQRYKERAKESFMTSKVRDLTIAVEAISRQITERADREARIYDIVEDLARKNEELRSEVGTLRWRFNDMQDRLESVEIATDYIQNEDIEITARHASEIDRTGKEYRCGVSDMWDYTRRLFDMTPFDIFQIFFEDSGISGCDVYRPSVGTDEMVRLVFMNFNSDAIIDTLDQYDLDMERLHARAEEVRRWKASTEDNNGNA